MRPSICCLLITTAVVIYMLFTYIKSPTIYCVLVTGKSECRNLFGKQSVQNFFEQDYHNKKLIVINHGNSSIIHPQHKQSANIHEHMVVKGTSMALGDMRNLALDMVPKGSYWTTWDDDDYRPPHYISWMYKNLKSHGADLLTYTQRYEYNYTTGFFWQTIWKHGFVTGLVKQDDRFRYKSIDSMEDKDLLNDYRRLGKRVIVLPENDPSIYIRLVHGGNTSLWVDPVKTAVKKNTGNFWEERDVPYDIKSVHSNFISDYYKEALQCIHNS